MLKDAGKMETAVRARVPQEHPLYFATGLSFVLYGPVLDLLVNGAGRGATVAAPLIVVAILAVTVATHLPYWRRYRQVRMRRTPKWVEWALALWGAAALFTLGILLDGALGFSFTLGGLLGAVPSLLWAERLRRTA